MGGGYYPYPLDAEGNLIVYKDILLAEQLAVRNYRVFDSLELETLKRVNLIVGKNNTGKTCLLESLWLFARRAHPEVIKKILASRHEAHNGTVYDSIGYLFHQVPKAQRMIDMTLYNNFHLTIGLDVNVDTGENDQPFGGEDKDILKVDVGWYARKIGDQESATFQPLSDGYDYYLAHSPVVLLSVDYLGEKEFYDLHKEPLPLTGGYRCVFVNAAGLPMDEVLRLWDRIYMTEQEEQVVRALQGMEPGIKRVGIKEDRVPFVSLSRASQNGVHDTIVPLRHLGEGINRLFGIVLALVSARGGFLLIDEIESGLHYLVQVDMWRIILREAQRLNVQVFATTHSWDCILALQTALQMERGWDVEHGDWSSNMVRYPNEEQPDQEDIVQIIRLERKDNTIVPVLIQERHLPVIAREQIEVR